MIENPDYSINKKDIIRALNNAADSYDQAAFLQREVANRLLERLELIRIKPKIVLDLGAATGYSTYFLEKNYPKSKIIAVDISERMLNQIKQKKKWFQRKRCVCAAIENLPFATSSADLIYSNLALNRSENIERTFSEIQRVLKPGGFLFFTLYGRDTFYELKESWAKADQHIHVHPFVDMHEIGDILLQKNFVDPVVDMEFLTITYNNLGKFLCDLKDVGMQNIVQGRQIGLTGKAKFNNFVNAYENFRNTEGLLPVTYEIIYGHAIGPKKSAIKKNQEVSVPLENIKIKK